MTKEQANSIIAENEAMVIGCTYNVLFTNDIVTGLTIEAVEDIKKSPSLPDENQTGGQPCGS